MELIEKGLNEGLRKFSQQLEYPRQQIERIITEEDENWKSSTYH